MNKRSIALIASGLLIMAGGIGLYLRYSSDSPTSAAAHAKRYYCPMHPTYTSDKPGSCPICNMTLVAMEEEPSAAQGASATPLKKVCLVHKCKMANCLMEMAVKPGEKVSCPICGTHIAEAAEIAAKGQILYYRHPMRPEVTSPTPKKDEMGMDYVPVYAEEAQAAVPVPGQATTVISDERRQMIGMKSEPVRRRQLSRLVRASARVAHDPDLFNAIAEYREAAKARDKVKDSPWPDVHERAEALVRASELKLRQLGLSESQINNLATSGDQTNLLIGSNGGSVWVYAQIYEFEVGLVKAGQAVEMTTPAFPGRTFRGVVKAVDPILSPETRSLKVRIEVPNPEGMLKLEMYVNAAIQVDLGTRLAVPEDALLETGTRQVVFVDLGEGRIEPREVKAGREAEGYYEVLSGLQEGERVVTSAQFLIDSESRLKAALGKQGGKASPSGKTPAPEHRH